MNVCGVVLNNTNKVYYFNYNDINLDNSVNVIVETEKGLQFAKVVEVNVKLKDKSMLETMKSVVRVASKEDYNKYLKNLRDSKHALDEARKEVEKLGLDMNLIDANYTFDRKQLIFNFVADERIDFRELVKTLAASYKTRIELHQIGVRDKAKMVGGIGTCGRALCCNSFLNKMDTISINMAKNQNIALNPSKINGSCGRLLCCLQYEDDVYTELRKQYPLIGDIKNTEFGKGEVVDVNVIGGYYTISLNGEKKDIYLNGNK